MTDLSARHQGEHAALSEPRVKAPWPESRLAALEIAAGGDVPALAELARVQLLASRGAFEDGEAVFARLMQADPVDWNRPYFFTQWLLAALSLQRADLVAATLNTHPELPPCNRVVFSPRIDQPMRFKLRFDAHGACISRVSTLNFGNEAAPRFVAAWLAILRIAGRYARSGDVLPGSVMVSLGDIATLDGLGFCAASPEVRLVPDPQFIISRGYANLRAEFAVNEAAWQDRRPIAFWRGATTGLRAPPEKSWASLQRIALCRLALEHPDCLDAGISTVAQAQSPREAAEIAAAGLMRAPVPAAEFNRYRFQIDIDGNSNAWQGLFMKLLSGSPVLKVESPKLFRQWYYNELRPWVNYVPVAADMSDLIAAIGRLRADDSLARRIGAAGRALALSLDYDTEMEKAAVTLRGAIAAGLARHTGRGWARRQ